MQCQEPLTPLPMKPQHKPSLLRTRSSRRDGTDLLLEASTAGSPPLELSPSSSRKLELVCKDDMVSHGGVPYIIRPLHDSRWACIKRTDIKNEISIYTYDAQGGCPSCTPSNGRPSPRVDVKADDAGRTMAPTRTIQLNRHHQIANALLRCRHGLELWRHSILYSGLIDPESSAGLEQTQTSREEQLRRRGTRAGRPGAGHRLRPQQRRLRYTRQRIVE